MYLVESFSKSASDTSSRTILEGVLKTIYDEAPWKWPYGLNIDSHDDIYMIRSASDKSPAGFVGWQERKEGMVKVGYYTIGLLPEHRGCGKAKEAVSKMLHIKSASVDKVKALIVEGNKESEHLADALHIPYVVKKAADKGKVMSWLTHLAGGALAGGPALDYATYGEGKGPIENFSNAMADPHRRHLMATNAGFGAAAGSVWKGIGPAEGVAAGLAIPAKDLLLKGNEKLSQLDIPNINKAVSSPKEGMSPGMKAGLGVAAGVGALGALGTAIAQWRSSKKTEDLGDMSVTLPTRKPGDIETKLRIPLKEQIPISGAIQRNVGKDVRRQLRTESGERKQQWSEQQEAAKLQQEEQMEAQKQAQLEAEEKRKAVHKREQTKMNMLSGEIDKLNVKKAATTMPAYDPNMRAGAPANNAVDPATLPPGTPASMANSPLATAGGAAGQVDTDSLQSKLDKLQEENINLKINQEAQKLAGKSGAGDGKKDPILGSINLGSSMDRIRKTLDAVKSASMQPQQDAINGMGPRQLNIQTARIGNRVGAQGQKGIQTPINLRSTPYGSTMHNYATQVRRHLMPATPSAEAQFMEHEPPQVPWINRATGLLNSFLQSPGQPGSNNYIPY
jgi:hypothetical protein